MSYLSTSYVVSGYVVEDWFGSGIAPPPKNYIGDNYLRPGYVLSGYLTNAGVPPTIMFASDTLSLELDEASEETLPVKLSRTDTLALSLTESFLLKYTRHVVAFETLQVSVGESRIVMSYKEVTDTLSVSLTESLSTGEGEFLEVTAEDDLDVEIDDPGISQFIEIGETLNVGLSDAVEESLTKLSPTDLLSVGLTEAATKVVSGALHVAVQDTLGISLAEVSNRHIFRLVQGADTLGLSLGELTTRTDGILLVYLQQFDTLDLTLTAPDGGVDSLDGVLGLTSSDALDVQFIETSGKVEVMFLLRDDELSLVLAETALTNKISINVTWDDANYPWGGASLRDLSSLPVFAKGFDLYQADSGDTFYAEKEIAALLERLGLVIYGRDRQGLWKEDPDLTKMVKGVYPLFRGEPGTVIKIYVGSQDNPEGPITWDGPHQFVLGQDIKVSPWISGKYIAIRFESQGQAPWTLLSYDIDITPVGRAP